MTCGNTPATFLTPPCLPGPCHAARQGVATLLDKAFGKAIGKAIGKAPGGREDAGRMSSGEKIVAGKRDRPEQWAGPFDQRKWVFVSNG